LRVLLIKTSSLGDVIHALPALTDAARAIPGIRSTGWWKKALPRSPPGTRRSKVIPVAIRRWRKNLWQTIKSGEWKRFKQSVRATKYDLVIDAQGLLKSAWLTRYVKAPVAGLDKARPASRSLRVSMTAPGGGPWPARGGAGAPAVRHGPGYDLPKAWATTA
jgi:heptosyltransferase-1